MLANNLKPMSMNVPAKILAREKEIKALKIDIEIIENEIRRLKDRELTKEFDITQLCDLGHIKITGTREDCLFFNLSDGTRAYCKCL